MKPAGRSEPLSGLKRRALSIGAVRLFDHAVQLALPMVLVRCLDTATFGEYRLLWLAVGTIMTFATLNMCSTLYYFVPRSEPRRKRLYVHQTLLYFALAGVVCAFLVSPWNPLLPPPIRPLGQYGWLPAAFVALWVFSYMLDYVPSVDERTSWQVCATLGSSALRVLLVALGAWLAGEMAVILWLLVGVALFRSALLVYYVAHSHGLGRPWLEREVFWDQLKQAAPLGANQAVLGLRGQADQWVAASLFSVSSFAAFSIAGLVGKLMLVLRRSVMQSFLPSMSRLQAAGDLRAVLELNSRGNILVARLLYPVLAFAFVFAEEIVTVLYTSAYLEAAPAIRTYVVGMLPMAIETGSLVLLLRRGGFALRLTGFTLVVSVALSWSAALWFGLAGAAAGSVVSHYVERGLMLRHLARHTGIALARLQDWGSLVMALAFAAATAALAWILVERVLAGRGPLVHLAAGAAVFALAYAAANLRRLRLRRTPAA